MGIDDVRRNVRRLREARSLGPSELSLKAGLSRGHVGLIEAGKIKSLTIETVRKIAAALEVQAHELDAELGDLSAPARPSFGGERTPRQLGEQLFAEEIAARKPAQLEAARVWVAQSRRIAFSGAENWNKFDWFEQLRDLYNADRKAALGTTTGHVPPDEEDPHAERER